MIIKLKEGYKLTNTRDKKKIQDLRNIGKNISINEKISMKYVKYDTFEMKINFYIVVKKKICKLAVRRNKIKRMMRENLIKNVKLFHPKNDFAMIFHVNGDINDLKNLFTLNFNDLK